MKSSADSFLTQILCTVLSALQFSLGVGLFAVPAQAEPAAPVDVAQLQRLVGPPLAAVTELPTPEMPAVEDTAARAESVERANQELAKRIAVDLQPAPRLAATPARLAAQAAFKAIAPSLPSHHAARVAAAHDLAAQPAWPAIAAEFASWRADQRFPAAQAAIAASSSLSPELKGVVSESLGLFWFDTGYFSRALQAHLAAWNGLKDSADPAAYDLASQAGLQAARILARIGRQAELADLLAALNQRRVSGELSELRQSANTSLAMIRDLPQHSFKCGPFALISLRGPWGLGEETVARLREIPSPTQGFSVREVADMASKGGLAATIGFRPSGASIVVPSVVHWRAHHFAAIIERRGDLYLVRDPTFGQDFLLSAAAINDEASGLFLIRGNLPTDWRAATANEASQTYGRGSPGSSSDEDDDECECEDCCTCGAGGKGGSGGSAAGGSGAGGTGSGGAGASAGGPSAGGGPPSPAGSGGNTGNPGPAAKMARYGVSPFQVSLRLYDSPVGYVPAYGPSVAFTVRYNSRSKSTYSELVSNLGPKWSMDLLEYVQNNGSSYVFYTGLGSLQRQAIQLDGNGDPVETSPHYLSRNIVRPATGTQALERVSLDGTRSVFGKLVNVSVYDSRYYLTQIIDRFGHALTLGYDSQDRLATLTDALGQVSTVQYADPVKTTRITGFTDAFGRSAQLAYDAAGNLQAITDPEGITSAFLYQDPAATDAVTRLTTPYGPTTFEHNPPGSSDRILTITDPLGRKSRYEYKHSISNTVIPKIDPLGMPTVLIDPAAPDSPSNRYDFNNDYLYYGNTFYWDEKTYITYPPDSTTFLNYDKAYIVRWAREPGNYSITSPLPQSSKRPGENRIWYYYPGQQNGSFGIVLRPETKQPAVVARILEDGTTQAYRYTYTSKQVLASITDPKGRTTLYDRNPATTAPGFGLDLVSVRQQRTGGSFDLLAQVGDYTPSRIARTYTDAARQSTTLTVNDAGQVITTTDARNDVTRFYYSTSPSAALGTLPPTPDPTVKGYLRRILAPGGVAYLDLTYDSARRLHTVTTHEGYTVTYTYDNLDRLKRVTYPDTTYEELTYSRLDAVTSRDREGRISRGYYDGLGRLVVLRDPANRYTSYDYCYCGAIQRLVDAEGRLTRWDYDILGRLTAKIYPDQTRESYFYDATSRLDYTRDALGQETHYTYDRDDSLLGVNYVGALQPTPAVSLTYDPDYPRIATITDGQGLTSYTYHPVVAAPAAPQLGAARLATVDGPLGNDTLTYGYDSLGRPASRALGTGNTSTLDFDALGRLQTLTNPLGSFAYNYVGATGRLDRLDLPGGLRTQLSYRPLSEDFRLEGISHQTSASAVLSAHTYTQSVTGRITAWTQQLSGQPNREWSYGYDAVDQLNGATVATPSVVGSTPATARYHYDRVGNRVGEQQGSTARTGAYDSTNRLQSWTGGGLVSISGTTSEPVKSVQVNGTEATRAADQTFNTARTLPVGNNTVAIAATDFSNNTRTANYSVNVTAGEAANYTYDLAGRMTTKTAGGATTAYQWDAAHRLVTIIYADQSRTEFAYDGYSRRVRITEKNGMGATTEDRRFVWDGATLVERRAADGTTVVTRYFGQGEVANGQARLYLRDHLGSVHQLVNPANGQVTAAFAYDSYGITTQVSGTEATDTRYTGHYYHAKSGLHLTLFRAYDAQDGRWLSRDPIGERGGVNLYGYVGNDPINWIDALGLSPLDPAGGGFDQLIKEGNPQAIAKARQDFQNQISRLTEWLKDASKAKNHEAWRKNIKRMQERLDRLDNRCPPNTMLHTTGDEALAIIAMMESSSAPSPTPPTPSPAPGGSGGTITVNGKTYISSGGKLTPAAP